MDDSGRSEVEASLIKVLEGLKKTIGLGQEVRVKWIPGAVKFRDGRRLEEEVVGDTIFIYAEDPKVAGELVAHGFAEWLLNRHTKRYRMLINKLIELFEEIQYEEKERLVEALTKIVILNPRENSPSSVGR